MQGEHRIEQWITAHIPLHIQLIHQLLERIILVFEGLQCAKLHILHIAAEALLRTWIIPQGQRANEHPDDRRQVCMWTSCNRCTDDYVLLCCVVMQQRRICRQQHHVQGRSALGRQLLQAITDLSIQSEHNRVPFTAAYCRTSIICP